MSTVFCDVLPSVSDNFTAGKPNMLHKYKKETKTPFLNFKPEDIITINISGKRFQTFVSTLDQFPETLLGSQEKRRGYFHMEAREFIFFRHRGSFEAILYFYQSGGKFLYRPENIPLEIFLEELKFFQLGKRRITRLLRSEGLDRSSSVKLPENEFQRCLFQLLECPETSVPAKIMMVLSVFAIILSIVSLCLETVSEFRPLSCSDPSEAGKIDFLCPYTAIEFGCMMWFTAELILRFFSAPNKTIFFKYSLNIIDLVAILPFYANLVIPNDGGTLSVLRIVRLVRVLSIFKLGRHSKGLKTFGKAMKASTGDMGLLVFFFVIIIVIFSSGIYFAEMDRDSPESGFTSIPEAFWFSLVTVTSVGYGDVIPKTIAGKLITSLFMLAGIIVCALPMVIIVENFDEFYHQQDDLGDIDN